MNDWKIIVDQPYTARINFLQHEPSCYTCFSCNKRKKTKEMFKDFKAHLRDQHKIKPEFIPELIPGSYWHEDIIPIYHTTEKCPKCQSQLDLLLFEDSEFLVFRCWRKENNHYHSVNKPKIFIAPAKKKYFCGEHGHNSQDEPCLACTVLREVWS